MIVGDLLQARKRGVVRTTRAVRDRLVTAQRGGSRARGESQGGDGDPLGARVIEVHALDEAELGEGAQPAIDRRLVLQLFEEQQARLGEFPGRRNRHRGQRAGRGEFRIRRIGAEVRDARRVGRPRRSAEGAPQILLRGDVIVQPVARVEEPGIRQIEEEGIRRVGLSRDRPARQSRPVGSRRPHGVERRIAVQHPVQPRGSGQCGAGARSPDRRDQGESPGAIAS